MDVVPHLNKLTTDLLKRYKEDLEDNPYEAVLEACLSRVTYHIYDYMNSQGLIRGAFSREELEEYKEEDYRYIESTPLYNLLKERIEYGLTDAYQKINPSK